MNIIHSALGNFISAEFSMTPVIANEFIPLVVIQNTIVKDEIQYYSKPSFEKYIRKPNTLKNIRDGFEMGYTTRRIEINGKGFFIAKGVFFSETGVPLMVCAMKKEAFLNESISKFSGYGNDNFSYKNYVLFYSTSFYTDPSLTPLNRRLQKEILQSCYEKGIEVRVIPPLEIEKNTFARLFEVKKTKSLTQLEAYMNQVLPNFLHNEGEDTFVEQEFEPVVIHREELSVEDEALLFDNEPTPVAEVPWEIPAQTVAEARELAELQAEAAQFDPQVELPNQNDEDNEDFVDEETAHTVFVDSETYFNSQLSMPDSQTAQSLVERLIPLQNAHTLQMLATNQAMQLAGERAHVRAWQSIIEVVDDTE